MTWYLHSIQRTIKGMYFSTAKETHYKTYGVDTRADTGREAGILLFWGLEDSLCRHTLGNTRRSCGGVLTEAVTESWGSDVRGGAGGSFWLSMAGMRPAV